eukprot:PhM_4_TR8455/c0_g1_i1/m.1867
MNFPLCIMPGGGGGSFTRRRPCVYTRSVFTASVEASSRRLNSRSSTSWCCVTWSQPGSMVSFTASPTSSRSVAAISKLLAMHVARWRGTVVKWLSSRSCMLRRRLPFSVSFSRNTLIHSDSELSPSVSATLCSVAVADALCACTSSMAFLRLDILPDLMARVKPTSMRVCPVVMRSMAGRMRSHIRACELGLASSSLSLTATKRTDFLRPERDFGFDESFRIDCSTPIAGRPPLSVLSVVVRRASDSPASFSRPISDGLSSAAAASSSSICTVKLSSICRCFWNSDCVVAYGIRLNSFRVITLVTPMRRKDTRRISTVV